LPKRGFTNIFRKEYVVVNLEQLAGFESGAKVDPEILKNKGLVKNVRDGLKILGAGELPHALHIRAHKFSKSAVEKIQKAGGTIEIIA
jgi:large subunit ribosomal protein L15